MTKRIILLAAAVVLLAGCKTTTFTKQAPDGTKISASDCRLFVNTAASLDAELNTNGTWHVTAGVQSSPDSEGIKSIIEAAVTAAIKASLKP